MKRSPLLSFLSLALLTACDPSQPPVEEARLELQSQLLEADARLSDAADEAERLDAAVAALEAALADVDRAALDLSAGDPQLHLPDLEANLANAKARLRAVRDAADAVSGTLAPTLEEDAAEAAAAGEAL